EDLFGRGGAHFLYRLQIAPADRPNFSLKLLAPKVDLPRDGTTVVEMQVERNHYNGPIRLIVEGDDQVRAIPEELPAGSGNGKVFVTLARQDDGAGTAF